MPWIFLEPKDISAILLFHDKIRLSKEATNRLSATQVAATPRENRIIEIARDMPYVKDGEVEIDELVHGLPVISEGDDNGAYVQAWVWADFYGTELTKDEDDEAYPENDGD